jgi:hypothetical protein
VLPKEDFSYCTYGKFQDFASNLDLLDPDARPLEYVTVKIEGTALLRHGIGPSFDLHSHLEGYTIRLKNDALQADYLAHFLARQVIDDLDVLSNLEK